MQQLNDMESAMPRLTEMEQLQDIMEDLPEAADYAGPERREYSLTKGDVMMIYKIARIAYTSHVCPFKGDEADTLATVAKNINRTQKIASTVIVTSIVGGMLTGIWYILSHIVKEFVKSGKI